jgi:hypothetical protein
VRSKRGDMVSARRDDEPWTWRDADIETRDLKSIALIARDVREQSTGCKRGLIALL